MAKYTKSEMTPELLHLNLQYFFEAPARKYQEGIDEIVLSTESDEIRWIQVMNHWFDFLQNPPVESTKLRDIAENLTKVATEENIETILTVFDELAAFMASSVSTADDEKLTKVVEGVAKLNVAIYAGTATMESEKKRIILEEKQAAEELLEAEIRKAKTSEQKAIDELQKQINELGKTIEGMSKNSDSAVVNEAKRRISETKETAVRIANKMENEVKLSREAEEIEKQEELVRRSDEKLVFETEWLAYINKYLSKDDEPTADLFKKFLIDVKGLTPDQVEEIAVSAAFFGNELGNFLDFDEELQRVKKLT